MGNIRWNVSNEEEYLNRLRRGEIGCSDCGTIMSHNEIEKAITGENLCPDGVPICDNCYRDWEYYFYK